MAIKRQQDVVELQITVDNAVLVEILKSEADLSGVEPVSLLIDCHQYRHCRMAYCARLVPN